MGTCRNGRAILCRWIVYVVGEGRGRERLVVAVAVGVVVGAVDLLFEDHDLDNYIAPNRDYVDVDVDADVDADATVVVVVVVVVEQELVSAVVGWVVGLALVVALALALVVATVVEEAKVVFYQLEQYSHSHSHSHWQHQRQAVIAEASGNVMVLRWLMHRQQLVVCMLEVVSNRLVTERGHRWASVVEFQPLDDNIHYNNHTRSSGKERRDNSVRKYYYSRR